MPIWGNPDSISPAISVSTSLIFCCFIYAWKRSAEVALPALTKSQSEIKGIMCCLGRKKGMSLICLGDHESFGLSDQFPPVLPCFTLTLSGKTKSPSALYEHTYICMDFPHLPRRGRCMVCNGVDPAQRRGPSPGDLGSATRNIIPFARLRYDSDICSLVPNRSLRKWDLSHFWTMYSVRSTPQVKRTFNKVDKVQGSKHCSEGFEDRHPSTFTILVGMGFHARPPSNARRPLQRKTDLPPENLPLQHMDVVHASKSSAL
ncbi:uncharacterized protein CIMG_10648 [Coccidioides immitis RS]|uniref:Uncharacterized protein n=1 Tax=Coccidioides immitis (strain RS) TaxID=246410 RepID=A0A0D8JSC3_COCIM|nr:uncharacterized protein CIMG_10648 [Coccidioides immitis RS]KJF60240.1 hypothetical protein CIMG_10648 [Coccidioides immitis RS]